MINPSRPDLTVISLGAGRQSTGLFIASALGLLPRADAAIFSDTGWEPVGVYRHLERLEREIGQPAGIPIYRVSNGNIRDDALNPDHRFASMPLYTRGPCPLCSGTKSVEGLPVAGDVERPQWLVKLARGLGLGPASRTMYDGPCPSCDGTGIKDGFGRRQCTREYKLKPINEQIRRMLGAEDDENGIPGRVPSGRWAEEWVGFSTDESDRQLDLRSTRYAHATCPLIDILNWSVDDCQELNARYGFPKVEKSACIGCPFHGNAQWRYFRDNDPDAWADAVDFDDQIRHGHASATAKGIPLRGHMYLHRSRVPLDQAPIDHVTIAELKANQGDLLAGLNAATVLDDLEKGDQGGCSPHSCPRGGADDEGDDDA